MNEPSQLTRRQRLLTGAIGAVGLMLLVVARSLEPDARGFGTHEQLGLAPCYFHELTGKVCPLCGGTTAWAHLLQGEIVQAAQANFAAMLLCVGVVAGSLLMMWLAVRGRWPKLRPSLRQGLVIASGWLAVAGCEWLLRLLL